MARDRKYTALNLIPAFRIAARARNEMRDAGFTDNGGAIASATRILDILGMHICYPGVTHTNNYKASPVAEFTVDALAAYRRGERVFVEHVAPQRAFTIAAMDVVDTMSDDQFADFIKARYRLVLLTADETTLLNRHNRSRMVDDRLGEVGLVTVTSEGAVPALAFKIDQEHLRDHKPPLHVPSTTAPAKTTLRKSKFANTRIYWTGTRNGRGADLLSGGCFVLRQVEMAGRKGIAFEDLVLSKRNLTKTVADHLRYDEIHGNIIAVAVDGEAADSFAP